MDDLTPSDHRARQAAFAAALSREGLPGAVVVSRGGATFDRHGDLYYLANAYQVYSYLPETPGLFTGRSHAALVIDGDGRSILCLSVEEYDAATVVADEVRWSPVWAETLAGAMRDLGLATGMVGLVGSDVLPVLQDRMIHARLPDLVWADCDGLLGALRRIKSPAEQALIRGLAGLHAAALAKLDDAVAPGRTEAEIMAQFAQVVTAGGAGLYFTALSSGPRIANWCSVGLPGFSRKVLESGDMLRIDTGIVRDGYLSDFGHTLVCGPPTADQRRLIATVQSAVDTTIAAIRPGRLVSEVVAAGEQALAELGVTREDTGPGTIHSSFPAHWGHGLGMGWEYPIMTEGDATMIEPGMYLAIERTLTMTGTGTAAAEQTLLVTETGADVISEGPDGRWRDLG